MEPFLMRNTHHVCVGTHWKQSIFNAFKFHYTERVMDMMKKMMMTIAMASCQGNYFSSVLIILR